MIDPARVVTSIPLRRPLAGMAFFFILGIWCGLELDVDCGILLVTAAVLWLTALLLARRWFAVFPIYAACLVLAWVLAALTAHNPSPRELAALMDREREYVEIVGVISSDPLPDQRGGQRTRWSFPVRVEGIRRLDHWQRVRGNLWVVAPVPADGRTYGYGERWKWVGMLEQRRHDRRAVGVSYVLRVKRVSAQHLSSGHGLLLREWCLRGRKNCAQILSRGIEEFPEHTGVLDALLLGYRRSLPPALREVFATTGTLHIFAISGLHVGVMALLLIVALKAVGLARPYWILCLAPFLIVYTLGTGMKTSAVRACIMAVFYWSAPIFGRKADGPSALSAAALVILAWAPGQLLAPGFVLSFVVVSGIMLMYPALSRIMTFGLRPDPWRLQRESVFIRWPRRALVWVGKLAAVSTSAWIASAPLTAYYFNLFSPAALAGNVFIVPGAFVVVLTGCLSLVLGSSFPACAEVFNHANRVFVTCLLAVANAIKAVPCGHWFVCSPPWYVIVFAYAAAPVVLIHKVRYRLAIGFTLAVLLGAGAWHLATDKRVVVDVLDVGQGDAAFINVPGQGDVLVDSGPRFYSYKVIRHLRRQGVDRLRAVVLTHPDARHVGGALDLLDAIPVEEIWCSPYPGHSPVYRKVLAMARTRGIPIRNLECGDAGTLGGGLVWEVFHPVGGARYKCGDDASLVMRFARDSTAMLFMGGATRAVQNAIMRQPLEPAASILAVGNHGGQGACGEAWLKLVMPDLAVISVGAFNRVGDPNPAVLRRLEDQGVEIWRTDQSGGVRIAWKDYSSRLLDGRAFRVTPLPNR